MNSIILHGKSVNKTWSYSGNNNIHVYSQTSHIPGTKEMLIDYFTQYNRPKVAAL